MQDNPENKSINILRTKKKKVLVRDVLNPTAKQHEKRSGKGNNTKRGSEEKENKREGGGGEATNKKTKEGITKGIEHILEEATKRQRS